MTTTPESRTDPPTAFDENAAYVRAVHDRGLAFDLATLSRRRMIALGGGAGVAALFGAVAWPRTAAAETACLAEIESETNGPYPADGTNGPDVRVEDGIVRSDIRSSFGSASGTAEGVPTTLTLTIQDLSCAPLVGAAVYVWHCNRDGNYSLYSSGITDQNYLRGIQETDSAGQVTFTTIFPACYSGRWPHIHFEVYASLAHATSGDGPIVKTSQVAIPESACDEVFATTGYSKSVSNLSQVSLATDNVFGDDSAARELATVTGNVTDGYALSLTLTVDPTATETGGGTPGGGGQPPSGQPTPPGGGQPPSGQPTSPSGTPTATATPSSTPTATATPSATATPTATPTATASPSASAPSSHGGHPGGFHGWHIPRPPWWHGWWPFG